MDHPTRLRPTDLLLHSKSINHVIETHLQIDAFLIGTNGIFRSHLSISTVDERLNMFEFLNRHQKCVRLDESE